MLGINEHVSSQKFLSTNGGVEGACLPHFLPQNFGKFWAKFSLVKRPCFSNDYVQVFYNSSFLERVLDCGLETFYMFRILCIEIFLQVIDFKPRFVGAKQLEYTKPGPG